MVIAAHMVESKGPSQKQSGGSRVGGGKFGGGVSKINGARGFQIPDHKKKSSDLGSGLVAPQWDLITLAPFKKELYQEHPKVTARSKRKVEAYRSKRNITVSGEDVPNPIQKFKESNFPDYCMKEIKKQGYDKPTPIQAQAWPIAMSGKDLVGVAATGSGKTLAFILPGIVHINHQTPVKSGDGPIVVVLAPTRELAQQIQQVATQFGQSTGLRNVCVYGGESKHTQLQKLRKAPQILIATPGRLLDFLGNGDTNMNRCTYLVLDEADRMLDMGFEPQIRKIIQLIRPDRQTVMFSATWPREVKQLADEFQKDVVMINIGSKDLSANHNIHQIVEVCREDEKEQKLYDLLMERKSKMSKTLIFASTKRQVDDLTWKISDAGFQCYGMHGDKKQIDRNRVLQQFKKDKHPILVATDVAARGLDVDDIEIVVNYDFPSQVEDYVHRIGRTARRGNTGTSYTFFTQSDGGQARKLVNILKEANQEVNPKLETLSQMTQTTTKRFNVYGTFSPEEIGKVGGNIIRFD